MHIRYSVHYDSTVLLISVGAIMMHRQYSVIVLSMLLSANTTCYKAACAKAQLLPPERTAGFDRNAERAVYNAKALSSKRPCCEGFDNFVIKLVV